MFGVREGETSFFSDWNNDINDVPARVPMSAEQILREANQHQGHGHCHCQLALLQRTSASFALMDHDGP